MFNHHTTHRSICLVLMALLLLAACAPPAPEPEPGPGPAATPVQVVESHPEPIPVKVQLTPFLGASRLHMAQVEGFFAEQGLAVEFVTIISANEALPALIQGDLDVATGAISAGTFNAIARGAALRIVAQSAGLAQDHCASSALLARGELVASGALGDPVQLRNMRLATNPAGVEGFYIDRFLKSAGVSIDELQTTDVAAPALAEALQSGQLDLANASEPWITRLVQAEAAVVVAGANEVLPDYTHTVVLFGPNLLDKNPEAGRRFMVAFLKAVRQYSQGKTPRNVALIAEHTGLDPALLEEICWSAVSSDGRVNTEGILDFQTWAFDRGLVDRILPVAQFWDARYVDYANQVLDAN